MKKEPFEITDLKQQVQKLTMQRGEIEAAIKSKNERIAQLQAEEAAKKEKGIKLSQHAIERFKQRIMYIPERKIKQLLLDDRILPRYEARGDGMYIIPAYPFAACVIKDFTIVTVINRFDPIKQLEDYRLWMHHRIECWCDAALGKPVTEWGFKRFVKQLYH